MALCDDLSELLLEALVAGVLDEASDSSMLRRVLSELRMGESSAVCANAEGCLIADGALRLIGEGFLKRVIELVDAFVPLGRR